LWERELTGEQKAAILLIALGPEVSAEVLKHLDEQEIEQVTLEIATARHVPAEVRASILKEFHQMARAQEYISQGGVGYAKDVLERALGTQKALDILQRLTANLQVRPFDFVRKADPEQLLSFIQNEHPQTIALIMAYLTPEKAAAVLAGLPPDQQADVARRLAIMDRTSPEVLKEIERVLEHKLSSLLTEDYTSAGGIQLAVDILNQVDRTTEKAILERLEVSDPELAEEIKRRMFLFEDIVHLDDRSVQRVLREVDIANDLPLALKGANDEVRAKIFKNVSKRAAADIQENIEYMGPVLLRDVEAAQQKIVNIIRKLEEEGEIIIARGQRDEVIV